MNISKKLKVYYRRVFLIALSISMIPSRIWGQGLGSADDNLKNVQKGIGGNVESDINVMVGNIIKIALSMIGLVFLILTVYAGYLWMTAGGNEENVSKAKEILKSSIMGLFIVVSAYAITYFVTRQFSQ